MRRKAKVDSNQAEIVRTLSAFGASVQSLAPVGDGVPDLLVGVRGVNFLIEVKGEKGRLNAVQEEWHTAWRGSVLVLRSKDEAVAFMRSVTAAR